jgi:hypothetical protein
LQLIGFDALFVAPEAPVTVSVTVALDRRG